MRLNNHIREKILNAALQKSGVFEQEKEVEQLYADFAESARKSVVTDSVIEKVEQVKSLCKALNKIDLAYVDVNESSWVYINCAGERRLFDFSGVEDHRHYDKDFVRVTPRQIVLKHADPLLKKLQAADKKRKQVRDRKEHLKLALQSTLWSVTTDKKLYEVWPEAKEFMPIVEGAPTVNFPALPIKELNKMIGLPSSDD